MRSLRLYVSSRRAEPPDMAWETYPGADIELPREIPENIYFSGHSFILTAQRCDHAPILPYSHTNG